MSRMMSYKKRVFVIGHKNPDLDSIASAIGYAYLKNTVDREYAYIPARAGDINDQTKFALGRFDVETPVRMEDLTPTISDMELKEPIVASPRDPIKEAASLMKEKDIRLLPIVDSEKRVLGIVGLEDIARHYVDSIGRTDLSATPADLDVLVNSLGGKIITNPKKIEKLTGRVFIAASKNTTILNRIEQGDIVIVGDRQDTQIDLINSGCSALVITNNPAISDEVTELAMRKGTLLISSSYDTFSTAKMFDLSVPVSSIMSSGVVKAEIDSRISEVKQNVVRSRYRSVLVVDAGNRLISMITRTDLLGPIKKRVILVDHNEMAQAADGVEEAEVVEMIDHHRVGGMSTPMPIHFHNEPVGSTCTLVAELMFLHHVRIPEGMAGLLLSAILSDTLVLTLSTTTERDKKAARRLARLAEIRIDEFGKELLAADMNIKEKTARELLFQDQKEYVFGDKRVAISQIMTADSEGFSAREDRIMREMERLRREKRYDLVVLLVINPVAREEEMLVRGNARIVEDAFGVELRNGKCSIPRILSRKKDFVPRIEYVYNTLRS
jgi:manganese-dependent inorganic pyrophosphatase